MLVVSLQRTNRLGKPTPTFVRCTQGLKIKDHALLKVFQTFKRF